MHDDAPDELTLRAALIESNNRAATLLQQQVGTRPRAARRRRAPASTICPTCRRWRSASGLVTPLAITAAFAVFPNGGLAVRPRDITRVRDADGGTAFEQKVDSRARDRAGGRVPDGVDAARRDRSRHRRRRPGSSAIRFPVGGKTGTTNEFKDAWFVGFSSSVVVGVWVGFDQPQPIGADAYGARYALPIWADFMQRAARVRPPAEFERPAGLAEETLCAISYRKPVDGCPIYTEYFKEGDEIPDRLCTIHRGSIRQRLTRTVQGWMSEAGRRIRGIFR